MALEQGILTEIIDFNKESPPEGSRPYHWVGGGGARNLRPDTYIYIYMGADLSRNPYFRIMVKGSGMVVVTIYVWQSTPLADMSSTR